MADLQIIQLMHPGPELGGSKVNKGEVTPANDGSMPHTRKYFLHGGQYIDKQRGTPKTGNLQFWGEWEQAVEAIKVRKGGVPPRSQLKPIWPQGGGSKKWGPVNTDPLVFGPKMYYSNCQQLRKSKPTLLTRLEPGSMILFGSCFDGGFLLDTVFVVGEIFNHEDFHKGLPGKEESETFRKVVWKCLKNGHSPCDTSSRPKAKGCGGGSCPPSAIGDYTLYQGEAYDPANPKEPFCFVPARLDSEQRFNRVQLAMPDFISPKMTQSFKAKKVSEKEIKKAFEQIVETVLKNKCVLATSIDDVR